MVNPTPGRQSGDDNWCGSITYKLWWRRFRPAELEEIISRFLDLLPTEDARQQTTVELTHVRNVHKSDKANRTIPGNGLVEERRTFRTVTVPGQFGPCLEELAVASRRDEHPVLRHFVLRCSADKYIFEIRIGSREGRGRQRVTVYASWPGRSPGREIEQRLYKYVGKRHLARRAYVLLIYVVVVDVAGRSLAAYVERMRPRFQAPNADVVAIANEQSGPVIVALFIGLTLWLVCSSVGHSGVRIGLGKLARTISGWGTSIGDVLKPLTTSKLKMARFPKLREWANRSAANDGLLAVILAIIAIAIGLGAWLFPVK